MKSDKQPKIEVDLTEFTKSVKKIKRKDWPKAVVNSFSELAEAGAIAVKKQTRRKFKLHSDFVTRGIRAIPISVPQKSAAERALRRYGDFSAAVYLRGSPNPKTSLEFMAHHEEGETRKPQDKYIAMPMPALKRKSFRTGKGRVKKRWKPEQLLKRYRQTGSTFDGNTTTNKGKKLGPQRKRLPGAPFIIEGTGGTPMIARRRYNPKDKGAKHLEFLYALKKKGEIKRRWEFTDTVWNMVKNKYGVVLPAHIRRIPNYDR